MSNPAQFSTEIRDAEQAILDASKPGHRLTVNRQGIPTAAVLPNMTLSPVELKRFRSRLAKNTDPAEARSTIACMQAIEHRGFLASVDPAGRLVATAPRQVERHPVDERAEARARAAFRSRTGGQTAFKR